MNLKISSMLVTIKQKEKAVTIRTLLQAPINELYDTMPTRIPSVLASPKISKAESSLPAWPAASINALKKICMKYCILELAPQCMKLKAADIIVHKEDYPKT